VLATDVHPNGSQQLDTFEYMQCDVTSALDIARTTVRLRDDFGGLDILINNAGILRSVPFFDLTPADWDRTLEVNLKACCFCAQAAAKLMIEGSRAGSIINVGSIGMDFVSPDIVPYSVSKGGVRTLTYSLAVALAPNGIRVNAVAPGTIDTELNTFWLSEPGAKEATLRRTPLNRLGTPDDVAAGIVFLASKAAGFITATVLPIHGGKVVVLR
jgi:NAD(P)-dependent dehydrogenase (short-subunit alcohol dehydrogenase family)